MKDGLGRTIDYMRISITDRCNLRCTYCMPEPVQSIPPSEILRYEEILRIAAVCAELGIVNFKVTGGEPLVRRNAAEFAVSLKNLAGVRSVTLTTNGMLLEDSLPLLREGHIDGVNISLDARTEDLYRSITGFPGVETVLGAIRETATSGIPTKVNTLLLAENAAEWMDIAGFAEEQDVSVRFIELMPLGHARDTHAIVPGRVVLEQARERYPDLAEVSGRYGNGPAVYYESASLRGRLGLISAGSRPFCAECNRIRLTSTGGLRTCLGYPHETDLRTPLRKGATDTQLRDIIRDAVMHKPEGHCFASPGEVNPAPHMSSIGG